MAHILVVGGGVSGCAAALELASAGHNVTIVEKEPQIGGKVREYGCKATDKCSNCGLCLSGNLWQAVERNGNIDILTSSVLIDLLGCRGNFTAVVKRRGERRLLGGIAGVIVAVGFERPSAASKGHLELASAPNTNIISGCRLEQYLRERTGAGLLPWIPSSAAFLQCFGSRDVQEKAQYCSRVCCGYSVRMALTLKYYYPGIHISFFYMDLQQVDFQLAAHGRLFDVLAGEGFEFVRCRPVKIKGGASAGILYEDPGTGGLVEREFDLVVLSEGIHPAADTEQIAEICGLGTDGTGFLKCARDGAETGVYVAGCASGPKKIVEAYNEALSVAGKLMLDLKKHGREREIADVSDFMKTAAGEIL